jgi:hypothetical protein
MLETLSVLLDDDNTLLLLRIDSESYRGKGDRPPSDEGPPPPDSPPSLSAPQDDGDADNSPVSLPTAATELASERSCDSAWLRAIAPGTLARICGRESMSPTSSWSASLSSDTPAASSDDAPFPISCPVTGTASELRRDRRPGILLPVVLPWLLAGLIPAAVVVVVGSPLGSPTLTPPMLLPPLRERAYRELE